MLKLNKKNAITIKNNNMNPTYLVYRYNRDINNILNNDKKQDVVSIHSMAKLRDTKKNEGMTRSLIL